VVNSVPKRNQPAQPSKAAANITPKRAVKLLRDQLDQIGRLSQLSRTNSERGPWEEKALSVLTLIFGDPSVELARFKKIWFNPGVYYDGQPESDFQEAYTSGLEAAKNLLEAILFEYEQAHEVELSEVDHPMPAQAAQFPPVVTSNLYFVAHEFSASGLDDLRIAIKEALSSSGLEPYFADKEIIEGQIFIDKILPKIRNCRFGIYDISNPAKPNVFIELGAAIAIGARYYIVIRKGVSVPSDLQGLDRIEYQSFEHLKTQLREKIKP
jgi:predicted nucleotide-binding protein with TIR-like domain